jgi:chromosome segregation ATPase
MKSTLDQLNLKNSQLSELVIENQNQVDELKNQTLDLTNKKAQLENKIEQLDKLCSEKEATILSLSSNAEDRVVSLQEVINEKDERLTEIMQKLEVSENGLMARNKEIEELKLNYDLVTVSHVYQ